MAARSLISSARSLLASARTTATVVATAQDGGAARWDRSNEQKSNQYLTKSSPVGLPSASSSMTIAGWMYIGRKGGDLTLASKYLGTGNQREWLLYYINSADRFSFNVSADGSSTTGTNAHVLGSPKVGRWYFVVGWHNRETQEISIQVNDGSPDPPGSFTGNRFSGSAKLAIGATDSPDRFHDGKAARVGLWSRVLTAGEILRLYNGGRSLRYADLTAAEKVSLVSWWELSEASGTRADSHGSNTLAEQTASTPWGSGPGGSILPSGRIDGDRALWLQRASTQYLSRASNASFRLGADVSMTVAGWFYVDDVSAPETVLASKYNTTGNNREWLLYRSLNSTTMRLVVSGDGSATTGQTVGAPAILAPKRWHFVVAWHDADNDQIGIQVDNQVASTTAHTTGVFAGTADFLLGNQGALGSPWSGRVARFGFWNGKVLSASERTQLFNSARGTRYADLPEALKTNLTSWWDLSETSGTRSDSHGTNHLTPVNSPTWHHGVLGGS